MRPLVLFAGIRRKNEILEIFLYYLFLVGTDTEESKCSLHAEQNETKGRKTHAQTIYSMDTAADGTRADCDVHCVVACAGYYSCRWAW